MSAYIFCNEQGSARSDDAFQPRLGILTVAPDIEIRGYAASASGRRSVMPPLEEEEA